MVPGLLKLLVQLSPGLRFPQSLKPPESGVTVCGLSVLSLVQVMLSPASMVMVAGTNLKSTALTLWPAAHAGPAEANSRRDIASSARPKRRFMKRPPSPRSSGIVRPSPLESSRAHDRHGRGRPPYTRSREEPAGRPRLAASVTGPRAE